MQDEYHCVSQLLSMKPCFTRLTKSSGIMHSRQIMMTEGRWETDVGRKTQKEAHRYVVQKVNPYEPTLAKADTRAFNA